MPRSPTEQSKKLLKKLGYQAAVVEKWNAFAGPFGIRQDLYGIIDILAIKPGEILGIQACAKSGASSHIAKAMAQPLLWDWLEAGGLFEIWTWRKIGLRGKQKKWHVRRIAFNLVKGGVVYREEGEPNADVRR